MECVDTIKYESIRDTYNSISICNSLYENISKSVDKVVTEIDFGQRFRFSDVKAFEIHDEDDALVGYRIIVQWNDETYSSRDCYDTLENIELENIIFELIVERVYNGSLENFWRDYDRTTLYQEYENVR